MYLEFDTLLPTKRTQVDPETFSLVVSVRSYRSGYEPGRREDPTARSISAHDGELIFFDQLRGHRVVVATRMLAPDVELTYAILESRLSELKGLDQRVVAILNGPKEQPGQPEAPE